MPVQNIGTDIIKAYLAGDAQRRQELALAHKIQQDTENAAERQRQFNETLTQQKKQFDAEHSLRKALNEIQHVTSLSNLQRNAAETGLTPPGATETVTPGTTEQDFEQLNQATAGLGPNQIRPDFAPISNRNLTLSTGDSFQVPDFNTYKQRQAEGARTLLRPQTEAKIETAGGVARATLPSKIELVTNQMDLKRKEDEQKAKEAIELQKLKDQAAGERGIARNQAMINAANIQASKQGGLKNRYLTPEEADKLNVPVGSTIEDVKGKPVVKRLDATSQKKFDTLSDLHTLTEHIANLGAATDYSAVGSWGRGTLKSAIASQTEDENSPERQFRSELGNFDGMLSELRAGKVITANEEARLRRYIPQLNSSKADFKSKLSTFQQTIQEMQGTLLAPAARRLVSTGSSTKEIKKTFFKDGKAINTVSRDGGVTFEEE